MQTVGPTIACHITQLTVQIPDALKSVIKQIMPDIIDTLQDDENKNTRMAGVRFLSIPAVKGELRIHTMIHVISSQFSCTETSHGEMNRLVPTLVNLLSDSEEDVRIAVLQTLSDLAKQGMLPVCAMENSNRASSDVFRESINRALQGLLDALKRGDWKTRVAALATWSGLAQDSEFKHRCCRIAYLLGDTSTSHFS